MGLHLAVLQLWLLSDGRVQARVQARYRPSLRPHCADCRGVTVPEYSTRVRHAV